MKVKSGADDVGDAVVVDELTELDGEEGVTAELEEIAVLDDAVVLTVCDVCPGFG